ncbi:MAG TPA: nicotinate-nucleotide--dimethylbenzimidazole phosphoribosyltransferase [Acidobacteriaceae bacterium]|nr:nicotinate-nucleotide--dimethylbenzimidazole phosphoribosyltransferase [Acidobacteriaceae bacterium]
MNTVMEPNIEEVIGAIAAPPETYLAQARTRLDALTKPLGSLGRLEDLAAQWFAIRQGNITGPVSKAVYVFAADHGITAEGVSAYPAKVTQQMVLNFLSGGAAINVLARLNQVEVKVVDVGVDADLFGYAGLTDGKVRRGSRNMLREPAMTAEEVGAALLVGLTMAEAAHEKGNNLIAVGEMGIGNTTAASVMTAALTGMPASLVTGKGTGLDSEAYARKCRTVEAVLKHHFAQPTGPRKILRCAGGLEIAAMTGMILGAARRQMAIVMDGFISTAAAAIACGLAPAVRSYLFAGHQSQEPGHRILLTHLDIEPILDLNMRLGEGTGAVLAMPVLEAALRLYQEMATFSSAGISGATA